MIQTIGRAARNLNGFVILYGDVITESMRKAISETERRRKIQQEHNEKHGITPTSIKKRIKEGLGEAFDGVPQLQGSGKIGHLQEKFGKAPDKISVEIEKLRVKMKELSAQLEFEEAAKIRDEIK